MDETSYLAGKLVGLLSAYVAIMPMVLAGLIVLSLVTGFALGLNLFVALALSMVPAAGIVTVGLLLSAAAKRVRSSLLLFIATVGLFVGVGVSYSFVSRIPIDDPASPILPLRDALAALEGFLARLSPFTYLEQVFERANTGSWVAVWQSLSLSVIGIVAAGSLAILALRWRGVRAREE